jgi:hypothetical protein
MVMARLASSSVARRLVALTAAALAGAAACTADDAPVPSAEPLITTGDTGPATTPATATTGPATTTTTPVTTPTTPPLELVVEQIAEFADVSTHGLVVDGSTLVMSQAERSDASSLVRIDATGTVVQRASFPDDVHFGLVTTPAGVFVHGFFAEPEDQRSCGVRPLDLATFTVGPTLALPEYRSCTSAVGQDDLDPAVVLLADGLAPTLFRLDTRTGTVTTTSLLPAVAPEHAMWVLTSLGGVVYAWLTPPEGPAGPVPQLIARIDPAGGVTTVPALGFPEVADGRLVVDLGDGTVQVLDPVTLAPTVVPASDVTLAADRPTAIGAVAFTHRVDDAGTLVVDQVDPATGAVSRQVSIATGLGPPASVTSQQVALDGSLVVVVDQRSLVDGEATAQAVRVFRARLRTEPGG